MSDLNVIVKPNETVVSAIKSNKTVVSAVTIAPQANVSLGSLTNVDASNPDNGETLVYEASSGKYVVKEIQVNSNNITNISGGTF